MGEKALLHSLKSFESFVSYLQYKGFSTDPSGVRWGIISVFSTFISFLIAFALGVLAVWATFFDRWDKMTEILWAVLIIVILIFAFSIIVFVFMVRFGIYCIKNPNRPMIDVFIRGFVKGGLDIPYSLPSPYYIEDKAEEFGVRIGKHVKMLLTFPRKTAAPCLRVLEI